MSKEQLAEAVRAAEAQFNRALSDAWYAGLTIEVDLLRLETHELGDPYKRPLVTIDTKLFAPL